MNQETIAWSSLISLNETHALDYAFKADWQLAEREREREREIFIRKKQASRRDMPIKPGAYCLATYQ